MATITGTVVQTSPIPTQTVTGDVLHYYATATQTLPLLTQAVTVQADYTTAQVVQTLPFLTQAVTGQNLYWTLVETVTVSDLFSQAPQELLEDAVVIGDAWKAIYMQLETSTVNASDEFSYTVVVRMETDTVYMSGYPAHISESGTLRDTVQASDELNYFFSYPIVETVNLSDTLTAVLSNAPSDVVQMVGTFTNQLVVRATLVSTVRMSDDWQLGKATTLVETVYPTDTYFPAHAHNITLSDTVNTSDVWSGAVSTFEELTDEINVSGLFDYAGSAYNATLTDVVQIHDALWAADLLALAWVMNTETTGLSAYDNFDFVSIAAHDGTLYVASNGGIFRLGGDADNGQSIDANVLTGFLDFNSPQTKRISDIYVGYTGGEMEFDVETYDGPQEVYTYAMEEREVDAPRNNRLKVGRGLSSRYWRFGLRNLNGADFQIYDIETVVGISKRRL